MKMSIEFGHGRKSFRTAVAANIRYERSEVRVSSFAAVITGLHVCLRLDLSLVGLSCNVNKSK